MSQDVNREGEADLFLSLLFFHFGRFKRIIFGEQVSTYFFTRKSGTESSDLTSTDALEGSYKENCL